MWRKKTSANRYNETYNHNFEFMSVGGRVVCSGGGVSARPFKKGSYFDCVQTVKNLLKWVCALWITVRWNWISQWNVGTKNGKQWITEKSISPKNSNSKSIFRLSLTLSRTKNKYTWYLRKLELSTVKRVKYTISVFMRIFMVKTEFLMIPRPQICNLVLRR